MKVFVTGAASGLAQVLLPALCASPAVESVTGIAVRPARFEHPKFRCSTPGINDPAAAPMLVGHDALVHLAFIATPGNMGADAMFDLNVRAAHKLFHAARSCGVKRFIHLSSALVYGPAVHAAENSPLNPLPSLHMPNTRRGWSRYSPLNFRSACDCGLRLSSDRTRIQRSKNC